MNARDNDNWDDHWSDLNDVTEKNPAQHYRHQLVLEEVSDCLKKFPSDANILDFGSGQGDLAQLMAPRFPYNKIVGFELSQVGVDISKLKCPDGTFIRCNLLDLLDQHPEFYGQGQIGICSEVMEHLDDPAEMLRNICQYLAPGALLIITVPSGPMNEFEKSIGHRQHFTKDSLEALVRTSPLRVIKTYRAGFPFFNCYKIMALLRGKKLREDANGSSSAKGLMLVVLRIFDFLFKLNTKNSPFGWQMMVVAEKV